MRGCRRTGDRASVLSTATKLIINFPLSYRRTHTYIPTHTDTRIHLLVIERSSPSPSRVKGYRVLQGSSAAFLPELLTSLSSSLSLPISLFSTPSVLFSPSRKRICTHIYILIVNPSLSLVLLTSHCRPRVMRALQGACRPCSPSSPPTPS